MAKRYTRINWQNKPNTATPISAENLNKMDKGIKDCDDAIGDLALLNTNNKTDLVSAINEQNNNLGNLKSNYALIIKGPVTSQAELDAILNDTSGYLADSIYEFIVNIDTEGLTLGGGKQVIRGYKFSDDRYGWQQAIRYNAAGISLKYRSKYNGTWRAWVDK